MTTKTRRVTHDDIEASIKSVYYFTAAQGAKCAFADVPIPNEVDPELELLTFCVMVLQNGFMVVGQSACVDAANFDRELGEAIARTDAVNKIWPLLGYALKQELSQHV